MSIVEETNFIKELEFLINKHGIDAECGTPDYILTDYIIKTLDLYKETKEANESWHSKQLELDFVDDLHAIKITQEHFNDLKAANKIIEGRIYIIVEKPEEENYLEI